MNRLHKHTYAVHKQTMRRVAYVSLLAPLACTIFCQKSDFSDNARLFWHFADFGLQKQFSLLRAEVCEMSEKSGICQENQALSEKSGAVKFFWHFGGLGMPQ